MTRWLYSLLIMVGYQAPEDLIGHSVVQKTLYGREGPEELHLSMGNYWNKKG